MSFLNLQNYCQLCQTSFTTWTLKQPQVKIKEICKDCYIKLFEEPSFDKIFGHMKYGDHWLILGTTDAGKTNLFLFFFKHTKLRTVWFHSVRKVDAIKEAEIVLTENEVLAGKLEDVLKQPEYKKVLIAPTPSFSKHKKNLSKLFDTVCDTCFLHTDEVYNRYMKENFNMEVGKDFDRMCNIVLMNDELMDVAFGPRDSDMSDSFWSLQHKGRNHGISLFTASQRNQDIPKMVCNLSMDVLLFKLKQYDVNALTRSIEHVELIYTLPRWHFIHTSLHHGVKFYRPIPLMLWK
jgi:hypothetical protein